MQTQISRNPALLETLEAAFGGHPDDVLGVMRSAVETLAQLEAMFAYIKDDLERNRSPLHHAKELAGAGAYLASGLCNHIDSQHEEYRDKLRRAGIECGGAA